MIPGRGVRYDCHAAGGYAGVSSVWSVFSCGVSSQIMRKLIRTDCFATMRWCCRNFFWFSLQQDRLIRFIENLSDGVLYRMEEIEGVIDTSSNLGMVV